MRKFNLKDNAAKRIKSLEKAGHSVNPEPAKETVLSANRREQNISDVPGVRVVWRTDTGLVRKNNQDAVIVGDTLFGVADGMGGHNAGEIASSELRDGLLRKTSGQAPDAKALEKAIHDVNLELFLRQEHDASLTGMGTTLTVMWMMDEEMILAQVGDSRAYLIRDGEMRQMTQDHSMVADMVRSGVLTEEQAACHPMRNYITRAVGTDDDVEVDMYSEKRVAGDRWLICSDGLYGLMSRSELERLASLEDPEEAAEHLMRTALDNGGRDNISLVLVLDDAGPKEKTDSSANEGGTEA